MLTLTLCFTKFPKRPFLKMLAAFFCCRSYSAPKMTGEQRREARWDSRHHILFAKDRFCWLSGMNKAILYKRDVRVFDNWSKNAISYALACNYFQISSGKELF